MVAMGAIIQCEKLIMHQEFFTNTPVAIMTPVMFLKSLESEIDLHNFTILYFSKKSDFVLIVKIFN